MKTNKGTKHENEILHHGGRAGPPMVKSPTNLM